MNNIVVFDIETNGLEVEHPMVICQVAALRLDSREEFSKVIKVYDQPFEKGAADMHLRKGRDRRWFNTRGVERLDAYRAFASFVGRDEVVLCGHNAENFDVPYLRRDFELLGVPWPRVSRIVDTMLIHEHLRGKTPVGTEGQKAGRLTLGNLAAHYGIRTPEAHDALGDVRVTAELVRRWARQ